MLTPTIFFNLIMQIVNGFRVFTESYVITNGGPMDSTLSYVLYLYQRAFKYFDMGYSCALAWILVLIIAAFTAILFRTAGFITRTDTDFIFSGSRSMRQEGFQ